MQIGGNWNSHDFVHFSVHIYLSHIYKYLQNEYEYWIWILKIPKAMKFQISKYSPSQRLKKNSNKVRAKLRRELFSLHAPCFWVKMGIFYLLDNRNTNRCQNNSFAKVFFRSVCVGFFFFVQFYWCFQFLCTENNVLFFCSFYFSCYFNFLIFILFIHARNFICWAPCTPLTHSQLSTLFFSLFSFSTKKNVS